MYSRVRLVDMVTRDNNNNIRQEARWLVLRLVDIQHYIGVDLLG